jgi:hypothetical protein
MESIDGVSSYNKTNYRYNLLEITKKNKYFLQKLYLCIFIINDK